MVMKLTPSQMRRVHDQARSSFCNCNGGACLLLEGGQGLCVQLLSVSGICCKYFRDAVLPGDRRLYAEIIRQENMNRGEMKCSH